MLRVPFCFLSLLPSWRLEIRYIHARRLIKYSFAASATTRTRFFALLYSLSAPCLPRNCFLPFPVHVVSLFSPLSLFLFPLSAHPHSLTTHSSRYIRVRSLLAITPARLQIALPPTRLALMLARRKRRDKRDGGLARASKGVPRKTHGERAPTFACVKNVASRVALAGKRKIPPLLLLLFYKGRF